MKKVQTFFSGHYGVFSILLIVKLIVIRAILFHDFNIFRGLVLDGSFILFFLGLIELFFRRARLKPHVYMAADALITTILVAVFLYVNWFNTMPSYFALFELGQIGAIGGSITALLNPWYLFLYADLFYLLFTALIKKYPLRLVPDNRKWIRITVVCAFVVCAGVVFRYKGADIDNSVLAAQNEGIFNYEVLKTYSGPVKETAAAHLDLSKTRMNEKIANIKGVKLIPPGERRFFGMAKNRNVIVVQAESFQNFLIHRKVNGQAITPNLNRLIDHSLYFPRVYQQVGPGNTSDAEFMMNTSLYPIDYAPTALTFGTKKFPSLPRLLDRHGYRSMTFHAGDLTFWNRDELYPALGFDRYYEKPFYGNQDIIGMGPSDDVLYSKGIKVLAHTKHPFYAMFVTLSSHLPFKIPPDRQTLKLPPTVQNTVVGNYLESQHYTDAAFGRFIEDLKKAGLWKNSILLFYGDHGGLPLNTMFHNDKQSLRKLLGHPYTNEDFFNIPFIVTIPGKTSGKTIQTTGGQLDFLPTLTNLLGIPISSQLVHFGQDLLNPERELVGIRYYLPKGSFMNDRILFQSNRGFRDGKAYTLKNHRRIKDFHQYRGDYRTVKKLENLSDAYLNDLPERN
ncbi:MAG TPA: LTA synthase family protein [Bacillales bacterium]|nr:LTA synthase family protein [Bacillales bacterium]